MNIDELDKFWETVPTPQEYLYDILRTHSGSKWQA